MRWLPLLLVLFLAACEKDFDAQYTETEKRLKADAARLDREMAQEAKKEPGESGQQK